MRISAGPSRSNSTTRGARGRSSAPRAGARASSGLGAPDLSTLGYRNARLSPIPGPAGPQGAAGSSENIIAQAADVDVSGLADGALLQFRASDNKFVARNQLDTTTGQLVFNGGNF